LNCYFNLDIHHQSEMSNIMHCIIILSITLVFVGAEYYNQHECVDKFTKNSINQLDLGNQTQICDVCQNLTKYAQKTLQKMEPIFDKMVNATEELCKVLIDKPLVKKCQTEVEQARTYYHWVADIITPYQLCSYMRLCK